MNRRQRRELDRINRRQRKREQKRPPSKIITPKTGKDFEDTISNVVRDIYGLTEKAVNRHVQNKLDKDALMKDIDKIFGKTKKESIIIKPK